MPVSGSDRRMKIYLRPSDQLPFSFVCGTMASSAVSSVLYMRDEAGNHAETRTGAKIYCGDAASFHEWDFRTRLRIAGKSCDQHIELMSKVCDGLRGDAFVAAQEVGFDCLCGMVDGRPCGVDTLRVQRILPTVLSSRRTSVQTKWRKCETARLATMTLLDTFGSDGPSDSLQRRTSIRHVTGPERLDT